MGMWFTGVEAETVEAARRVIERAAEYRRRVLGVGPDVLLLEHAVGVLGSCLECDKTDDSGARGVVRD